MSAFFYVTAPKASFSGDPLLNSVSAWTLASTRTLVLVHYESLLDPAAYHKVTWVVRGRLGPMSMYPPGTALLAAPFYSAIRAEPVTWRTTLASGYHLDILVPRLEPAVLVAALSSAMTVVILWFLLSRIGNRSAALAGALVFGFGTGLWSVASQALWMHGPAMMWIAVGLLYPTPQASGAAWVPAILTRPHIGIISSIVCGYQLIKDRHWRSSVMPAIATGIGACAFLAYNKWAFGSWSPFAAYQLAPPTTAGQMDGWSWITNIGSALVDRRRGLFVISPFLLVLLPGVREAWRSSPTWVKGAALGGSGYLLAQYVLHDYAGGERFFGYRYPLEGLIASAPLLFLSYQTWVRNHRLAHILFWAGVAIAACMQAWAVFHPYEF